MRCKQNVLLIICAVAAGFIGGSISNQLFVTDSAFAENKHIQHKLVIAEEFRVIDKYGNIIGSFGIPPHLKDIEARETSSGNKQPHQIAQLSLGNNRTIVLVADGDDGNVKIGGSESNIVLDATSDSAHVTFRKQTTHGFIPKIRLTTLAGTHISLQDDSGRERVRIGNKKVPNLKPDVKEKNVVSSIVLFNEKNNVVWSAP